MYQWLRDLMKERPEEFEALMKRKEFADMAKKEKTESEYKSDIKEMIEKRMLDDKLVHNIVNSMTVEFEKYYSVFEYHFHELLYWLIHSLFETTDMQYERITELIRNGTCQVLIVDKSEITPELKRIYEKALKIPAGSESQDVQGKGADKNDSNGI